MKSRTHIGHDTLHTLVTTHPVVVVCQYTQMDSATLGQLRYTFRARGVQVVVVKNSVARSVVDTPLHPLFQGSTMMLGMGSVAVFRDVWPLVAASSTLLCVGGLLEGRALTHLDWRRLAGVDLAVYSDLLGVLGPRNPTAPFVGGGVTDTLEGAVARFGACLDHIGAPRIN